MPSIFKQRIIRYVDEQGRRVSKSSEGAKREETKSKKWYGEFRDENGVIQRVPLARDRSAAQALLAEHVRNTEMRSAGLVDPFAEHQKKLLTEHIDDYENHLKAKGDTELHASQSAERIRKLMTGCGFKRLTDIDASKVEDWLDKRQRSHGRFSAQTRNFYMDAAKYFGNWLVKRKRTKSNPLSDLERVNVDVDRRHDRRALSDDEFGQLVSAANAGKTVEGMCGPDRAMLYVLAAWTGYRRGELASLTRRSVDLTSTQPSVKVAAISSKRRKNDRIPLHGIVVDMLRVWLETKSDLTDQSVLFPLILPSGHFRKTAKMMKVDLQAGRDAWLREAGIDAEERERRIRSPFLTYQDTDGLFADFHANRHTFISNLSRVGVPIAMAQKLARHSDPRLTTNLYTHFELSEQANAISQLPNPPSSNKSLVTGMVTGVPAIACHNSSVVDSGTPENQVSSETRKPLLEQGFGVDCQGLSGIHPTGFEPVTFGSVDRCSIQLS